jgi:DNA-binding PadR family transcriptional regulator
VKVTPATTLVLHALANGFTHGFDVVEVTELASGTVYPILRRLEREGLASGRWEEAAIARDEQRPLRRYYALTAAGQTFLETAAARYRAPRTLLARARRLKPARS